MGIVTADNCISQIKPFFIQILTTLFTYLISSKLNGIQRYANKFHDLYREFLDEKPVDNNRYSCSFNEWKLKLFMDFFYTTISIEFGVKNFPHKK